MLRKLLASVTFAVCAIAANQTSAADLALKGAVGSCSDLVFTCENGQQYPMCPIAVSVVGEVITASLYTVYGTSHVRLVPMGVGYRYAGPGIWLDGFRENALLNFGPHHQIACTLLH